MLFSSYEFILLFLPICLAGYFLLAKREYIRTSLTWLVLCSLFYYSWWNYIYLWLMISSIVFNYFWGMLLSRKQKNHLFLIIGIACNLFLLGYFKYSNFFIDSAYRKNGHAIGILIKAIKQQITDHKFEKFVFQIPPSSNQMAFLKKRLAPYLIYKSLMKSSAKSLKDK